MWKSQGDKSNFTIHNTKNYLILNQIVHGEQNKMVLLYSIINIKTDNHELVKSYSNNLVVHL